MLFYYLNRVRQLGLRKTLSRVYWNLRYSILLFYGWFRYSFFSSTQQSYSKVEVERFAERKRAFRKYVLWLKDNSLSAPVTALFELGQDYDPSKIEILGKRCVWPKLDYNFWHSDWLLQNNGRWYGESVPFFSKVKVEPELVEDFLGRGKDIKVCWEVGRMHYLSRHALETGQFCHKAFDSFLEHCPYLGGVQWSNPMEVGIRAANIINAIGFADEDFSEEFLQKVYCSLNQHAEFINHYLETSATPNNHYIVNLVSYVYIQAFLTDDKTYLGELVEHAWGEILRQVLSDGSFYEGSTAYHRLSLEVVIRFCLLDRFLETGKADLDFVMERISPLFLACGGSDRFVSIGDDDSGKFIFGLRSNQKSQQEAFEVSVQEFSNFGLVVVQGCGARLTFRNFSVDLDKQPLGHFHHDQLSLTLNVGGRDVLLDPGSGAYTSNLQLREFMRSAASHSTFYVDPDPGGEIFRTNINSISQGKTKINKEVVGESVVIGLHASVIEAVDEKEFLKTREVLVSFNNSRHFLESVVVTDRVRLISGEPGAVVWWSWIVASDARLSSSLVLQSHEAVVAKNYLDCSVGLKKSGFIILGEDEVVIETVVFLAGADTL